MHGRRRTPVLLGILFMVGLWLRLAHIVAMSHQPWFAADQPIVDSFYYDRTAWNLACGDPWRTPEIAYATSPVYALWLAGVYRVFGHDVLVPRLIQAILGACVPLLLFHLGRKTIGALAGWSAAGLATFHGLLIFYDGELLKASLSVFLLVLGLCWMVSLRSGGCRLILAGIALALAIGMPGNVLPILLIVALWLVWRRPDRWRSLALFVTGLAIPLVPYQTRHLWSPPGRVPFAYPAGIHLYIGNGPKADGAYMPVLGITPNGVGHVVDAATVMEKETGRTATPREVSAWWASRTWLTIQADPMRFCRLALRKLRLLVNAYEIPNNEDFYYARRFSWVLRLPLVSMAVLAPLTWAGLCLTLTRRRPAEAWLYAALLCAVVLALVLSIVTARYRLPAVPMMCLLSGCAVQWSVEAFRERRWRRVGLGVLAGAAGAVLAWWPTPLDPARYMLATERKMRRYYPCAAVPPANQARPVSGPPATVPGR